MNTDQKKKISIVLPIYNEAKSLPQLFDELETVLKALPYEYEIIGVNDASKDDSLAVLKKRAKNNTHVRVLTFKVNTGQTAALRAGIEHAKGGIIIPMDSDLENDPHDIPKLIEKVEEGYDVVSGWRRDRWQGSFFTRKVPSVTANWLISTITGTKLHDYGCTFKAYANSSLNGVELYGEMHRFIPAYASWKGAKVTEVVVNHRPRKYGRTNYGISRTSRVLLDLLMLRFLYRYMSRPIHFFGSIGFLALFLGLLAGFTGIYLRLFHDMSLISTPLPTLSTLLIIVGVQFIGMGVLAEMIMRVYYETQDKKPYDVQEVSQKQ